MINDNGILDRIWQPRYLFYFW